MKKIMTFLALFFLAGAIPAWSESDRSAGMTGTLNVLVDGFPSDRGVCMIALCSSEENCRGNNTGVRQAMLAIKGGKAEWVLEKLPWGEYGIKLYHDENGNGKLDKILGIPREAYGFSNNARGTFGPPSYRDTLFRFEQEEMTIRITVQ